MLFVLDVFLAFILELHILFDCSGRVFPGGIVEGDGRSETLPQVTESHIKAASLESDRREGNRIREDFNRPETVIQERVCAIVTYQLSQSVVLQVILNTIPIIQSALSIISTSLSQLR